MDRVPLLEEAVLATQSAKEALDSALERLSGIEADYNRVVKEQGASRELAVARAVQEEELGIDRLLECRCRMQRWAGLVDDCVRVCRTYHSERVVAANVRLLLRGLAPPAEADLFAMTLLRHVRDPEDRAVFEAAKAILGQLQECEPASE